MAFKPVTLSFLPLFICKKTLEKNIIYGKWELNTWKHMEGKMYPLMLMHPRFALKIQSSTTLSRQNRKVHNFYISIGQIICF